MKRVKLTVVFRLCRQTGIDQWTNGAYTRTLTLTEEQSKMFVDDKGVYFDEVICEIEEENDE